MNNINDWFLFIYRFYENYFEKHDALGEDIGRKQKMKRLYTWS